MLFDDMDYNELRSYLDFLLWHYRVVDAFWYINIEKKYGTDEANRLNEIVWGKVSGLAAKRIKEHFNIQEKGLDGFIKAQQYFPWSIMVGYTIRRGPDEVIYSVPNCPTQASRIQLGHGEYACKEMHKREFESFAKEIDPNIRVECIHAPLDPHPEDRFCQWRFSMEH